MKTKFWIFCVLLVIIIFLTVFFVSNYFQKQADLDEVEANEEKTNFSLINFIKQPNNWEKEGIRIREGVSSNTLKINNRFWMFYTAKGIMLSKSEDGLNFDEGKIVLDNGEGFMVTNPSVLKLENSYRLFYEYSEVKEDKRDRLIYSAFSNDAEEWQVEGERFWDYGDGKPGEKFTSVPEIIRLEDETLRMYYTRGLHSAIAESKDEGLTWKKIKDIELGVFVLDPDIIKADNKYLLFFSTSDDMKLSRQWIGVASSNDGLNFVLDEKELILPDEDYNNVVDPDVIEINGKYRMYYGQAKNPMEGFSIMSVSTK